MATKIKIQIKNRWTGSVLFEYEKENNTLKDTVVEAVKRGADLRGAYLRGADLIGADLIGAYLRGADLGGADLGGWGKLQDILITGPLGSRKAYTTCYKTDKGIFVQCGCFRGILDEFAAKVKQTHEGNTHERDYLAMIEFVKVKFQCYGNKVIFD